MKNKIISLFLLLMLFSCSDLFDLYQLQNISITFNSNGGTGNMAEQSFTVGVSQKLSANIFTRSGYTFVGWNSSADGSGTNYTDKQSLTLSGETTSLTLYAQWQKNVTYAKVTFNSNGGTGNMAEQSFTVGVSQNLQANIFTCADYTFIGWNTRADGSGTNYADKQSLTLSKEDSLTLYAQWQKNIVKTEVSFASNGGSGNMPAQIFTGGESQNLFANTFIRNGYNFTGWNTKSDGSGTNYTDKQSLTLFGETTSLTLYAQWEQMVTNVEVIFDSNGGSGSMSNQVFTAGVSQNLSANTFIRNGYNFTGWNTKTDGSGTNYTDKQSLTLSGETTSLTLYAQWEQIVTNVEVIFDFNGGSGSMSNQIFTAGVSQKLSANIFTRVDYTFIGWNSSADGSGRSYSNEQTLTFSEETSLTLYAQWQKNVTYAKVTFNSNGGTGNMAEQSFTVGVSQKLSANIFTRSGYTFVGWNSSADGSGTSYTDKQSLTLSGETTSLTLYAQWQKNIAKMEISFASNGGSGNMPVQIFTEGESQNLFANTFIRNGYNFTGWNTKTDGSGTNYTDKQSLTLSGETTSLTLYAQWEQIVTNVEVIFDSNGGSGSMSNQVFTAGVSQKLSANTFARSGYNFIGWNTRADGSGTSYADKQSLTLTEVVPLTLYAQWEQIVTYAKVTFNSNGGSGSMSNQIFTAGVSQKLSANIFTRSGYTFVGWNSSADGSGRSYSNEESLTLNDETPLTLYAQWQKTEVASYFLVPNLDTLNLYKDSNTIVKEDLLGESVTLEECFDQVADEDGNLYFSYKNEDEVIIAKYANANVSEIIKKDGYIYNVRLSYYDSKLYVLIDNTINVVENGELKEIYEATEIINAFIVDNGYIYFAVQNFNENNNEIYKITVAGGNEVPYCSIDCDKDNSFISDMTIINGDLYLLQAECPADFPNLYYPEYWRGALVKVGSSQQEKFALSSSSFGTETSFYCPLRFLAVRKNDLLIMDDGFVVEDWEVIQKNRVATFDLEEEQIDFSDMTEGMLYKFTGSL